MTGRSSGRLSKTGSMVSNTCQAYDIREWPDAFCIQCHVWQSHLWCWKDEPQNLLLSPHSSNNVRIITACTHRHVVESAHLLYCLKKLLLVGIASLHRLIKGLQGIGWRTYVYGYQEASNQWLGTAAFHGRAQDMS